jgi:hypothetical protein
MPKSKEEHAAWMRKHRAKNGAKSHKPKTNQPPVRRPTDQVLLNKYMLRWYAVGA